MRELGISVYPGGAPAEEIEDYLSLAIKYGFTRVFTCLISASGGREEVVQKYGRLGAHARSLGMEVIADVSPHVFRDLGLSFDALGFFADLNFSGIRLDLGFSGLEESLMTYNPHGLRIETNISTGTAQLDSILARNPRRENLLGCHNFYPHRYTGLSRDYFMKVTRHFKEKGIRTAAFVSSSEARLGPWPLSEGLCTLECHRGLPIEVQAKDLLNTGLIDVVIIGNCFAAEDELKALGQMDRDVLTLNVRLLDGIPALERSIVLDELHCNRGDVSEYMIRSTQSRVKYQDRHFPLFNPAPIRRGDILIETSLYGRYAGELQLALQDMENSGRTNVVGRVVGEELFLLDHVRPWQVFRLRHKEG